MKRVWITLGVLFVILAGLVGLVAVLFRDRVEGRVALSTPAILEVDLEGEIVERFHDRAAADAAERDFDLRARGGIPDEIPAVTIGGAPLAIAAVLCVELLNTALEAAVDLITPDPHPLARTAKDVAAAAVLVMAIASVILGLVIFLPRMLLLVGR